MVARNSTFRVMLIIIIFSSCNRGPTVTVEELKEQIQKEIPIGSHSSQVEAFLDSKGISHSGYSEGKEYVLEKSDYVTIRQIGASIPDVERKMFVTYSIKMRFFFDENRNLVDYNVVKRRDDP